MKACVVHGLLYTAIGCIGCTVQQIDQMLGSEGGTYGPSSMAETDTSSETGPFSTADASMTGSDSRGLETSESSSRTDSSTSGGSVAASDGSSSETSESSSSSGGPEPVCGNGVVEDGETCDDGNDLPDDGCQACAKDSIIFVSSEVYQGFSVGVYLAQISVAAAWRPRQTSRDSKHSRPGSASRRQAQRSG